MYICGTTRGADDERIVEELKKLTNELKMYRNNL
jgi:hypothetical protein